MVYDPLISLSWILFRDFPTFLKFGARGLLGKTFGLSKLGKFDAVLKNWTAILNGLKVYKYDQQCKAFVALIALFKNS